MATKVLYVEDELFLGKIVKESLETRGLIVQMESDGAHVMAAFKKMQPDICVLDVMLPNVDGYQLAMQIRALDEQVPIIFLTAKTQLTDLVKGFELGGNDYIKKPFSMEELLVRIENLIAIKTGVKKQGNNTIVGDQIKIGIFTYYVHKQVLASPSGDKKLSFREAELLKYLYNFKNEVADRRVLLNELWGDDSFFNSRNLDVYITHLRSYLKEDSNIEILTIKGIGYRFVM
jgi:DNA-binding response OmpR family regulator